MQFPDFDAELFLREYWQKKPLLIRNPWTAWSNPLEPDDLAGLACEDEVESRLITKARATWRIGHGPFDESRFGKLGKQPWTLLVQAVDHYVPEVAALIEPFRFLPNWRIDDVMVSCASDGGGVGPHFDQYDVFLIQGLGRRRWQVGQFCDADTQLAPHDDLRLLADFAVSDEWVLEPGDILYVPPRLAHDGVAIGDNCMTYSVGFRAPSRSELVSNWCDDLLAHLPDDDRYTDGDAGASGAIQANPGEIAASALARLHAMVTDTLHDPAAFARWFGRYSSTRKYPDVDWAPEEPATAAQLRDMLEARVPLLRSPASRFSFIHQPAGGVVLFVDGQCHDCADETAVLAQRLCAQGSVNLSAAEQASDAAMELIAALYNQGSLMWEAEGED